MESEVWRAVVGYEGLYEVSSLGRLRRLRFRNRNVDKPYATPRLLSLTKDPPTGYMRATLCRDGRQRSLLVHSLALTAFVGPCPPGHEVSHEDGTRDHNAATNLMWRTRKDNHANKWRHGTAQCLERASNVKLTSAIVVAIRAARESRSATLRQLAQRYGVSTSAISQAAHSQTWRTLLIEGQR